MATADVMPQLCEEALNAGGVKISGADLTQPLFVRDSWFDRLRAGCFAGLSAVTVEGRSGKTRCRLRLLETAPGRLTALANWYSFRWLPQIEGADIETAADAMTSAFRSARVHAYRLTLSPVPAECGYIDNISTALRRAGWTTGTVLVSRSHWLETNGRSFAEWWANRPGRLRSTVQRKGKKGLVACFIHQQFSDALWDEYEAVYAASWKGAEGNPQFLRAWARKAASEGALRLGIARIDGRAVAVQFWTLDAGTAHIHKLAQISDAEIEARSPGTLLSHAMFAHAFDIDHAHRIDFGTGDDGYKRDWMEQSGDLFTITAVDLRQPRGWWSLVRDGLTRVAGRLHKS